MKKVEHSRPLPEGADVTFGQNTVDRHRFVNMVKSIAGFAAQIRNPAARAQLVNRLHHVMELRADDKTYKRWNGWLVAVLEDPNRSWNDIVNVLGRIEEEA